MQIFVKVWIFIKFVKFQRVDAIQSTNFAFKNSRYLEFNKTYQVIKDVLRYRKVNARRTANCRIFAATEIHF